MPVVSRVMPLSRSLHTIVPVITSFVISFVWMLSVVPRCHLQIAGSAYIAVGLGEIPLLTSRLLPPVTLLLLGSKPAHQWDNYQL